jgi:hypothetical protein
LRGQNGSSRPEIFAAAEGEEVRLDGSGAAALFTAASATSDIAAALAESRALVAMTTPEKAKLFSDLLISDGVAVATVAIERAEAVAAQIHPSVVLLEDSDATDVAALADRLRHCCGVDTPVVLITSREDQWSIPGSVVADRLLEPVKPSYARARIHAAIMRRVSRWQMSKKPEDEDRSIAELKRRRLLDTAPEKRLDRITRMAAAGFHVPIALITLLDAVHQLFKSARGLDIRESPREESFCAHAVVGREVLVVPNALLDDRFAENPLVSGPPGIRFYAGEPLILSGTCIGTLCIIDRRPRDLDRQGLALLKDLADLAVEELERAHPRSDPVDPEGTKSTHGQRPG